MDNLVKTIELIVKSIQAQQQIIDDLIDQVEKLKRRLDETNKQNN